MLQVFRKIYSLLTESERKQLLWLSLAVIGVALIEVAGIASIMPFMAVVGNPEVVESNQYLSFSYEILGFRSVNSFLIALGLLVFAIIFLSNVFKATVLWMELRFVHFRLYSISRRLLFSYLNRPYSFFLNQNTAILGKNILTEVSQFAHHVLRPCTQIFSKIVVVIVILALLLVIDPILALTIATVLGGAYVLLYMLVHRKQARLGRERFEANAQRFKAASEAFGGVKELKILNRESFFFDYFSRHAIKVESVMVKNGVVSQLPTYVMEVFSFGGILIIVLYFLIVKKDMGQTLPMISLYAFAGYRLMPNLQGIFSSMTLLRFNMAALEAIDRDLSGASKMPVGLKQKEKSPLSFKSSIQLSEVHFRYPETDADVIKNLNIKIRKNTSIGLVGGTGSGKTTTVDIILGLLEPSRGRLVVDGVTVTNERMSQWQRNLGYVPQFIYLSDDSLAANIAFGIDEKAIDIASVERAAKIANIHDFIVNELPNGYATHVGERGVRLSGGQRQRIGIARALYHDPEVLIMDEATSALDGVTEEAVMQAIRSLSGKKTIITIAHRLTTLKDCDVIYVIENGQMVEEGTYAELSSTSVRFLAMARTGTNDN